MTENNTLEFQSKGVQFKLKEEKDIWGSEVITVYANNIFRGQYDGLATIQELKQRFENDPLAIIDLDIYC
ncbi:hypothetical protein BHX94_12190 (plasmid) [Macrococcoides bohemicum]|uniref:Uncharacterized protein n=1 Tax=Macrococcoides bohemicum TaxID=1903056 RepID=A0A327ZZZ2_9STAP|nr:hypothetical protein [Macrococcus bohemicus]RAK47835.1 hypothetical protein BHX94_12190 [Macrococcus bohemicus]